MFSVMVETLQRSREKAQSLPVGGSGGVGIGDVGFLFEGTVGDPGDDDGDDGDDGGDGDDDDNDDGEWKKVNTSFS